MTFEEACMEVNKELLRIKPKMKATIGSKVKAYRKTIASIPNKKIIFKTLEFKMYNITFYVVPFINSKKEFMKGELPNFIFAKFYYKSSIYYAIQMTDSLNIFTKHFFERYIERHLKLEDCSVTADIVKNFCLDNIDTGCVLADILNTKYKNCIYLSFKDGMGCGNIINNKLVVLKTYIENETVHNGVKREFMDGTPNASKLLRALANAS